jgi:uncharacterized protein (TIGR03437 family)
MNPAGLTVDRAGNLYTTDYSGCHVRMVSPTGIITTVAGNGCGFSGDGGPATSALLDSPFGVATDGVGNLYVSEGGNRIRKIDASGTITTIAGTGDAGFSGDGGTALAAKINNPGGLAAEKTGAVYIADAGNSQIRKLTPPPVFVSGVVNGASLLPGPVSPGEIVIINGSGLGPVQPVAFQVGDSGLLSTNLSGTQVLFDGIPAAQVSVQANQITAIVPYEVAGEAITQLQVSSSSIQANAVTMTVATTAPGIFTQNSTGIGPGNILNADSTTNSPTNPAASASVITIIATGEGQTSPLGVDGMVGSDMPPIPVQTVSVQIGGIDAPVMNASGTPGLAAGFFQVAAKVPDGAPSGDAIPIVLSVGGMSSQPGVTISIQ